MIYVRLFGTPSVSYRGDPVCFPFKKAEALVYLLSVRKSLSRAWLAHHLWPDKDETSGSRNLRNALYQLRSVLPPSIVRSEGGYLHLATSGLESDMTFVKNEDFTTEAELKRLERPFLEGFSVEGLDEFNQWVQNKRDEFKKTLLEKLVRQARSAVAADRLELGLGLLEHAVAMAPWDEEICRLFMESLAHKGRLSRIVEVYATLRERLRSDMGLDPSTEITELYRSLFRQLDAAPLISPKNFLGDIWGRDNERAQILDVMTRETDLPVCVVLWGPDGVGRTALFNRITRDHRDIVGTAVVCRISSQNRESPWEDLFSFLEREGISVGRSLPPGGLGLSLAKAARKLSEDRRITLMLDEIRFLSETELPFLKSFLSGSPGNVVLFIVDHSQSFRINDGWLSSLAMEGRIEYRPIRLTSFSPIESGLFCRHLMGLPADAPLPDEDNAIYSETLGLPICLRTLVDLYLQGGGMEDLQESLEPSIRNIVGNLTREETEIMGILSVFDGPSSLKDLKEMTPLSDEGLLPAMEGLERLGLVQSVLRDRPATVEIIHPQIKRYFYRTMPTIRKTFIHKAILDRSLKIDPFRFLSPESHRKMIFHGKMGGSLEDQALANLSYLRLLVRGRCEVFPPIPDPILKELESENRTLSDEAERLCRSARSLIGLAALSGQRDELEVLRSRFLCLSGFSALWRGDMASGKRRLVRAMENARLRGDGDMAREALYGLSLMAIRTDDPEAMKLYSRDMVSEGDSDPVYSSLSLRIRGLAFAVFGDCAEGLANISAALDIMEDLGDSGEEYSAMAAMAEYALGVIALELGDLDGAEERIRKGLSYLTRGLILHGRWALYATLARIDWMRGDEDSLMSNIELSGKYGGDVGTGNISALYHLFQALGCYLRGDRKDETDGHLEKARFSAALTVRGDRLRGVMKSLLEKMG